MYGRHFTEANEFYSFVCSFLWLRFFFSGKRKTNTLPRHV
jgi:hypothetical protein